MQWECTESGGLTSCATVLDADDPVIWIQENTDVLAGLGILVVIALGFMIGHAITSNR